MIGDQIFFARLGHRADQNVLRQTRPREIPRFGKIADQNFGIGLRRGDPRENRLLQDTARSVLAKGSFKIRLFEIVALQDFRVCFTVKFAIKPLEGTNFNHLLAHACITRRQAKVGDQLIQSARADHPVQCSLIEANGLHFLWRDRAANLLLKLRHFALQCVAVGGDGYGLIAHFSKAALRAINTGRPKSDHAKHQ